MLPNIKAIMFLNNNNKSEKEILHNMEKEKLSPAVIAAARTTTLIAPTSRETRMHCKFLSNILIAAKNSRLLLSPMLQSKNLSLKEVKFFAQLVILKSPLCISIRNTRVYKN